jgi:hypothetical protein
LGGDLSGTSTSQTVSQVGGASAANIADAVTKRHTQNTDTGTTNQTFQIDSDGAGAQLKNVNGELQIRNAGDTAFANVRLGDLFVEGTLTSINSNEVNIGDSEIELNSDVTQSVENSSGGVAIRRLLSDQSGAGTITGSTTTITGTGTSFGTEVEVGDILVFGAQRRRVVAVASATSLTVDTAFSPQPSDSAYSYAGQAPAKFYFDNTSGLWKVQDGAISDLQNYSLTRKFTVVVGDGSLKNFTVSHNMNSRDVSVTIRQTNTPYAVVMTDVECSTLDAVTVKFSKAPTNNQYTITVVG